MSLSPITMKHHSGVARGGAAIGGMSMEFGNGGDSSVVMTELAGDEAFSTEAGLSDKDIDVQPLVTEKDMEEIFGADRVISDTV